MSFIHYAIILVPLYALGIKKHVVQNIKCRAFVQVQVLRLLTDADRCYRVCFQIGIENGDVLMDR